MANTFCPWCRDYDSATGDEDPNTLCLGHLAECEGLSVNELLRSEAIMREEAHDANH